MPGFDRTFDPVLRDYVDAPGGEYAETATIATAVAHQMLTEKDRWWGDPNAGSDLYLVRQQGAGVAGKVFAENSIRSALKPFVDAGEAADLLVVVEARANGRLVVETAITDVQHGLVEVSAPLGEV